VNRVLVTPRSLTAAPASETAAPLSRLEDAGYSLLFGPPNRQPSEAELLDLVPGCSGWIAGVERISARVLDAADRLKVISRNGSGIDAIDVAAARRNGIAVIPASGANAPAVAELAVALMLNALRRIPEGNADLKRGTWERHEGRELGGSTVGIVGCGAVGRRVAAIAAAFGARISGYDVAPDRGFAPAGFVWADLDDLVAASDIVTLHCPALPDEAPLLDGQRLGSMKPGAGIVNTARASLVDETALLSALDSGQVGWYATDVFAVEPPGQSALIAHPRVIATPHIGAHTRDSGRRAASVAVDNLLAALASNPVPAGVAAR
jgi:D-3-phosphoglycerate dehydrogenase